MWIIYALIHSLTRAAFAETNRLFKPDGEKLSFWQGLFAFLILLPMAPFLIWPREEMFYFAAAGSSLILTAGSLANLALSAERNSRHAGIHMPLEALAAFILWLVLHPVSGPHPAALKGIAAAFLLMSFALSKVRRDPLSWHVFLVVVPVGISYAVAGVVTKTIVPPYNVINLALCYAIVNFAVMTGVMSFYLLVKRKLGQGLTGEKHIRAGFGAGFSSAIGYTAFVAAVALSPNPGYVSALAMLLPVWLLIWRDFAGISDDINPRYAFLIGAGAVIMVASLLRLF